jgi:rhamnosyltransferase
MMAACRVAIVIPTLNAGERIDELLSALAEQDGGIEQELIAVDSGSSDGTIDRLRAAGGRVLEVSPAAFNHGETRNLALDHVSAELAVLLVQDAVPASRQWLTALIRPLLDDAGIAGSFGRQCPWPDASRLTSYYLSQWIGAQPSDRTVGPLDRTMFNRMSPADRHSICAFDNVCSCIRLSVWRRHRFRRTPIAEDLEWAREVLLAGHKLAYVADAPVWHSHERTAGYELRRTYLVHQRLQTLFGLSTIPTMPALVRAVASTIPVHVRLTASDRGPRRRAWLRGAALAVALPLGQYLGARSAREGRELLKTRGV